MDSWLGVTMNTLAGMLRQMDVIHSMKSAPDASMDGMMTVTPAEVYVGSTRTGNDFDFTNAIVLTISRK
jgi:hypothetical protein